MGTRQILHCDCNCFYASVEMQEEPSLRGKPIAVCGDPEARHGIVLTASYPAKRMGVRTGMAIWQAKQCCRDLIVVPPHYPEYVRYSGFVREILEEYTDQIEPFGLDENWLDVTGSCGLFGSGAAIARQISDKVKRELGITVSIGVANNKITAKLGSDYKKPDAITCIGAENYRQIVYPLPVEDLLYVGPATRRKLNGYGVRTIGQLAATEPRYLREWFGKIGYVLSSFARGTDQTPVAKLGWQAAVKSVGNSATTPRDLVCDEDAWLMLLILSESVAARLRELALKCTVVEVSLRDAELCSFTRQQRTDAPLSTSLELARTAFGLVRRNYHWSRPLRSIGVRASGLVAASAPMQLSLLRDESRREKRERLDQAVDQVRDVCRRGADVGGVGDRYRVILYQNILAFLPRQVYREEKDASSVSAKIRQFQRRRVPPADRRQTRRSGAPITLFEAPGKTPAPAPDPVRWGALWQCRPPA